MTEPMIPSISMFDFFLTFLHFALLSGIILVCVIVLKRSRENE